MPNAFDPVQIGPLTLANRVAMAPLTRRRAYGPGLSATALMAEYYEQRASAGLIISEAMQPSPVGLGYTWTPGIHDDAQVASWQPITRRVHQANGLIFGQLMHAGRVSHPELLKNSYHELAEDDLYPVGFSPVAYGGPVRVNPDGPAVRKPSLVPKELTVAEIKETINDFAAAAENCLRAGFDGVELHGANGYLIHQSLAPNSNIRADRYGGSVEGRIRFTLELVEAVSARIGAQRLALRVSPGQLLGGIVEEDPDEVYLALLQGLPADLAYFHLVEVPGHRTLTVKLREEWDGVFMLNPHEGEKGAPDVPVGPDQLHVVEDGLADIISFGTMCVSNPDLVERLKAGVPLTPANAATYYCGDHRGYTDYPTFAQQGGQAFVSEGYVDLAKLSAAERAEATREIL